jgi:hypothetical protein
MHSYNQQLRFLVSKYLSIYLSKIHTTQKRHRYALKTLCPNATEYTTNEPPIPSNTFQRTLLSPTNHTNTVPHSLIPPSYANIATTAAATTPTPNPTLTSAAAPGVSLGGSDV